MLAMLGAFACRATIVPRLSLEEMVARSETIVSGQVARIWTAWDGPHRFIWTHTEISVNNVAKGNRSEKVVVSEPGGVVDGVGMQLAGTPRYTPGEQVMVFLERMPNGYLRTAGMGQGKLSLSPDGRVHLTHAGADLAGRAIAPHRTPLQSLEAADANQVRRRVARLVSGASGRDR
jgi:hypothetical protein